MTDSLNKEAFELSIKILIITFIVLISTVNGVLLIGLLKQGRVFKSPKRYMVASFAFADIFFALFTLVIETRYIFQYQDEFDPSCSVRQSSRAYDLMHSFLNGVGLVLLCLELTKRRLIRSSLRHTFLVSMVFGALPWLLSLVVILPLVFVGLNDRCSYEFISRKERYISGYVVGMVMPACLALLSGIVMRCSHVEPMSADFQHNTASDPGNSQRQDLVLQSFTQLASSPHYANPPQYHNSPQSGHPPQYGNPPQSGNPPQYDNPPQYGNAPQYGNPPQSGNPSQYGDPKQSDNPSQYGDAPPYDNPPEYYNPPEYGNSPRSGNTRQHANSASTGSSSKIDQFQLSHGHALSSQTSLPHVYFTATPTGNYVTSSPQDGSSEVFPPRTFPSAEDTPIEQANMVSEQRTLLAVCILFFVLTVPNGIHLSFYQGVGYRFSLGEVATQTLHSGTFWMICLRAVICPAIWIHALLWKE